MRKSKPARSRAEWEALVAAWRGSGLTRGAFARQQGLTAATLTWWASRLRREGRPSRPALLPVHVVDESPAPELVVRLLGGRSVVVPPSFDAAELRRLIVLLEEPAC